MITTTPPLDLKPLFRRPWTRDETRKVELRVRTLTILQKYEEGNLKNPKMLRDFENIRSGLISPLTPEGLDAYVQLNESGTEAILDAKLMTRQARTSFKSKSNSKTFKNTKRAQKVKAYTQQNIIRSRNGDIKVPPAIIIWLRSVRDTSLSRALYPYELFGSDYKVPGTLKSALLFISNHSPNMETHTLVDYGLTLLDIGESDSQVVLQLITFHGNLMRLTAPAHAQAGLSSFFGDGFLGELSSMLQGEEGEKVETVVTALRQIVDMLKDGEVKDSLLDLKDSAASLRAASDNISKFSEDNPDFLKNIGSLAESTAEFIPMYAKLHAFWGSYGQYVPFILTALIYCMHHVTTGEYRKIFSTIAFMIMGIVVVMFPSEILHGLYTLFNKIKTAFMGTGVVQSGTSDVSDSVVAALSAFCLSGTRVEQLPAAILSKLAGFDRASTTFERLYTGVSEFMLDSFEYLSKQVGAPYQRNRSVLEMRIKEAGLFISKFSKTSYKPVMDDFQKCETHLRRINEDIATYSQGSASLLTLLRDHRTSLQKLQSTLAPLFGTSKMSRVEPVFALIIGAPGVGKSLTSEQIATEVTLNCLPESDKKDFRENPSPFIHNRIPNKFWEGYASTTFTTRFDDLGQMNEIPGQQDPELMDHVIRAVNTFPYPLNMAFEGKGKTMFESKFIIATSNLCDIVNETVREKGAIDRRIKFRLVAYPKDEYCVDTTKSEWLREFKPEVKTDGWVTKIHEYLNFRAVVLQPGSRTPSASGPVLSLDEVVERITKTVKNKIRVHNDRYVEITQQTGSAFSKVFPEREITNKHALDSDTEECESMRQVYYRYYDKSDIVPYCVFLDAVERRHPDFIYALIEQPEPESLKSYLLKIDQDDVIYHFDLDKDFNFPTFDPLVDLPETVWQKAYRKIKEGMNNRIVQGIVGVTSLVCAGLVTKKVYDKYMRSPVSEPTQQSRAFTSKGLKYTPKDANNLKEAMVQAGSYYDPARTQISAKIANRNLPHLSVNFQDNDKSVHDLGYGLFIQDDLLLVPNHFLFTMDQHIKTYPGLEMHVELTLGVNSRTRVFVDLVDFVKDAVLVDADDLALVRVPRCGLGPRPNVLKYIAKKTDHNKNLKTSGVLTRVREDGALIEVCSNFMDMEPSLSSTPNSELYAFIGDNAVGYTRVYKYPVATEVGDCGMPLSIPNTRNATAKIFGMHVLGCNTGRYGYATKLCQEDIIEAMSRLDRDTESFTDILSEEDAMAVTQCGSVGNVSHIPHINTVAKAVASASASKMEQSPFFEIFAPSATVPAILRPFSNEFGSFNPYALGLKKYCINQGFLDSNEVELVCRYMFENMRKNSTNLPLSKAVLSIEQACEGIPDLGIGPIPKNTSPGYPYVNTPVPGLPYRYRFFGKEPGYDFSNQYFEELSHVVKEAINKAAQGYRTPWFIVDNLKDEDLPREKVNKGKARVFCAVPLAKLIIDKMYFGAFAAWITSNKVNNSIAIGLNPYGLDWEDAARHIKKYSGMQYGAGDFSGFDGSQRGLIHQHICDQINKWYNDGPVNARIRRVLFADVYNSYHIRGDKIFEWVGGMTSGFYLTAHLNSLYNLFAFTRVYAKIVNYAPSAMKDMDKYLRVLVMGDDNIYGVHPSLSEYFSELALATSFGEIGLRYTNELKTEEIATSLRDFGDLEFCKRKFRYSGLLGRYVAPIRLDAIYASLDYFKKGRSDVDIKEQLNMITGEFALHGRRIFDTHVPKLVSVSEFNGYALDYTDHALAFQHMCEANISW